MVSVVWTGRSLDQRFLGYDWASGTVEALPEVQLTDTWYAEYLGLPGIM